MVVLVGAASFVMVGCREAYPHSFAWQPGDLHRSHGEPPEGGYYTNWDPYAAELVVEPVNDVNPVRTQHILIATVKDSDGRALPNRRVEWILTSDSIGAIVEVDASGWRASRGHKEDNRFAITHTNNGPHVLTRGNDDPSDDVSLEEGQTWCVITSPTEGTSHIVAYAPAIYDWDKHKVFVTKHWYDVMSELPPEATNRIGTPHTLVTKVAKHSDGTPLSGYLVNYKILSGPPATLAPGNGQAASVKTDDNGLATVTLNQQQPAVGTNEIEIQVIRPENEAGRKQAAHIHTGTTKKHWVAPAIAIEKTAPAEAVIGETFRYSLTVRSPGQVEARNVVVTDELPDGIEYVSSTPEASRSGQKLTWNLGTVQPDATMTMLVDVRALRTGTFQNGADVKASDGLADRSYADTVVRQAKLTLDKEGPEEVLICDPIEYTLTIRNTGDASAGNVRVIDELPEGLQTLDGKSSMTFAVESLAPGEARVARVRAKATRAGMFTNSATASADGGLQAEATAQTRVRQPKLEVAKTGPSKRYVTRPATYTITVRNTGDGQARNTVLTDMLPEGMTFVSASHEGRYAEGTVQWSLGTIGPDQSRQVEVTVTPTVQGTMTNRVHAKADCSEASGQVETAVEGISAILLETVDVKDPIAVGSNETYVITVTNQGSAVGTNIQIVCELPTEQEYVSSQGPTDAQAEAQMVVFAPLAELAPKAKVTYQIVAKGLEPGDVRFKVILTSDQMTSPVQETESTNIYE